MTSGPQFEFVGSGLEFKITIGLKAESGQGKLRAKSCSTLERKRNQRK